MSKLKISQLVAQKQKQKQQQAKQNQPKLPVLQTQFQNANRANQELTELIDILKHELKQEQERLEAKTSVVKAMSDMMRQAHPVINIQPDFYGSDGIPLNIKDFYRKGRNSFLRVALNQNTTHQKYKDKQQQIKDNIHKIRQLEANLRKIQTEFRRDKADQKVKNVTQMIKHEEAVKKSEQITGKIEKLRREHGQVQKQYNFKKETLVILTSRIQQLQKSINQQQGLYKQTYNTVAHRDYMQKVFGLCIKIQCLNGQIRKSQANLSEVTGETSRLEKSVGRTGYGSIWKKNKRQRRASTVIPRRKQESMLVSGLNTTGYWTTDRTPSDRRRRDKLKQWSIFE